MRLCKKVTHVLCISSERKEKDRAIRQTHEKRLVADLGKLKGRVEKGKGKRDQAGRGAAVHRTAEGALSARGPLLPDEL